MTCTFYFLQVLHKFLNPATELTIPMGRPTKEAKAEIVQVIIQCNLKLYKLFWTSYLLNHFVLFLQWNNYLFYFVSLRLKFLKSKLLFCWTIFLRSTSYNIFYSFILLINPKNFNISIISSSLNIISLLLPQYLQILEGTNASMKIYLSTFYHLT